VAVGRVGRPHGLDGSFVVEDASAEPDRFAEGAIVYVDRERGRVVSSKLAGGRRVIKLDRRAAKGAALEVLAADLPELEPGGFYAFQLVGLRVEEEGGRGLGRVQEVAPGVANDVLELDSGEALPMVAACIRSIDLAAGRIVVARGFARES
jgi:16S rRNA processing protein RimM